MDRVRLYFGLGIAIIASIAWLFTFYGIGPMVGVPSLPIDIVSLSLFVVAWTVGMVAMMFPTAVPMLLMFLHVGRNSSAEVKAGGGPSFTKALVFLGSYLGFWVASGVLFYLVAATALSRLPLATNVFIGTTVGLGVALIIVAIYQLSPIKAECLARCHPTSFVFRHYRGGVTGASLMGFDYAKYCIGCCWVMMVFLLVSATMGLVWMVAFTGIIFVERNFALRTWVPKLFGVGFLVAGAAMVLA